MINFYWKASIISNLSASQASIPFRSIPDLVKSPYQITLIKDSSYQELFEKSDNPVFLKAWETKFVDKSRSLKESLDEMVPLVLTGQYALFEGLSTIRTLDAYKKCKITDTGFLVSKMNFAFTLQKNSEYTEMFNDGIKKMLETGTLKRIVTKHQSSRPTCDDKKKGVPLALTNIAFAFFLLLAGMVAGGVLFILENIRIIIIRVILISVLLLVMTFILYDFHSTPE